MDIHAIRVSGNHQHYKVQLGSGRHMPAEAGSYYSDRPHVWLQFSIPKFDKRYTSIGYSRQPSERWSIPIVPEAFDDMALEMMKADPLAAIRAFGKAMQECKISALDADQAA